ncbi:MAG: hypothetical protein KKE55_05030 [Candidatus Omnitrophica bacterium]|nr:hypothetical protein [Candidatus Omnitrophota bacterium]MBU1523960.1 hypothetical protein [Candidatus Omnitrophota bacterium]MBU2437042.1 hypothetical protein [Candidatus Omnitrophota bacterium]
MFLQKNKRYLTGIDWIIHALDYASKKATGVGNVSQIVLELDGFPPQDDLRERLVRFIKHYPVTNGRPARDYNFAPYWKVYPKTTISPKLKIHELGDSVTYPQIISRLGQEINLSFDTVREHLVFHLIHAKNRNFVAMTFDHRLLDARGAEAFLGMFQQEQQEPEDHFKNISFSQPAHLNRWREKFKAGRHVNRTFLSLAKNTPPVLPLPSAREKKKCKFKLISFNKQETAGIIERAYTKAGYLMLMPYALAVTMRALQKVFLKRRIHAGDYVIPVSIDMRPPEKVRQEVFFNHVSFFIFRITPMEASNFSKLLESIKKQMYDQVKSGLLQDFKKASFLMRILPLSVLARLMHLPLQGEIASFCFSYVGETAYGFSEFMQKDVLNIFHMPRSPVPPGLGIFFNQFQGKLNVVISYIDGVLEEDELSTVAADIRSYLSTQ